MAPFPTTEALPTSGKTDNSLLENSQALGRLASAKRTAGDFWHRAAIDETHWNKSFPYQLMILEKAGKGYKSGDTFTLPISPSDLSISTPFAITTSVTLGGIVEEHNGAPIKMISFSGSTGLMPFRGAPSGLQVPPLANAILGGTLRGVEAIATAARTVVGANSQQNLVNDSDLTGTLKGNSGYYQFLLLRNFLESYAELKKTAEGSKYRLALCIWKDAEAWFVSPVSFDLKRSAGSALEYMYSIQLKSWMRTTLDSNTAPLAHNNQPLLKDSNALTKTLDVIRNSRKVLSAAKATLTGFRVDVDRTLFLPLREAGLFIKDALGVGLTLFDLPNEIVRDARSSVIQFVSSKSGFEKLRSHPGVDLEELRALIKDLGVVSGEAETQAVPAVGKKKQGLADSHPANNILFDPDKYPTLFDALSIGSLNLKSSIQKNIVNERARVRTKTRLDFENDRDAILKLATDYADHVGVGGTTYNSVYSRAPVPAVRTPTDDDWDMLYQLNQTALEFNRLAASTATDNKNKLTAMEYIAGQAQKSGIPFAVPQSAFSVPFPYGTTLEVLSNQYLGTPDRWNEIATLNNLRPPYVDEEGLTYPLLVNGSKNTVQIADGTKLYIGQPVWIASATVSREKRKVNQIKKISSNVWVVELDGDDDLEKLTTYNAAELFSFTPGTVNSLQVIYIPSDKPPEQPDYEPKGNEALNDFSSMLQVGGVDLLLSSTGDLAIGKDGDCRLSMGLANITQHIKLILSLEPGTLLRHPEVGFAVKPGTSTADITAQEMLKAVQASFVGDPTFNGINFASVTMNGPVLSISLGVGVSGVSHYVPVSFAIRY